MKEGKIDKDRIYRIIERLELKEFKKRVDRIKEEGEELWLIYLALNIVSNYMESLDSKELKIDRESFKFPLNDRTYEREIRELFSNSIEKVRGFEKEFKEKLQKEIEKVPPDKVRKYLLPFIQDKFSELAKEIEEELSNSIKDRVKELLYKDSISLFSELKESLPPYYKLKKEIEIDTTVFDIAVTALWFFGFSMMLFSSVITGGLITLVATPILATFIKDKIDKSFKEKAKRKAPIIVEKISDKFVEALEKGCNDTIKKVDKILNRYNQLILEILNEINKKEVIVES